MRKITVEYPDDMVPNVALRKSATYMNELYRSRKIPDEPIKILITRENTHITLPNEE